MYETTLSRMQANLGFVQGTKYAQIRFEALRMTRQSDISSFFTIQKIEWWQTVRGRLVPNLTFT